MDANLCEENRNKSNRRSTQMDFDETYHLGRYAQSSSRVCSDLSAYICVHLRFVFFWFSFVSIRVHSRLILGPRAAAKKSEIEHKEGQLKNAKADLKRVGQNGCVVLR